MSALGVIYAWTRVRTERTAAEAILRSYVPELVAALDDLAEQAEQETAAANQRLAEASAGLASLLPPLEPPVAGPDEGRPMPLPCPWCRETPRVGRSHPTPSNVWLFVECECGARSPDYCQGSEAAEGKAREAAILAWNRIAELAPREPSAEGPG